jgi:hypothetical protein
MKKYILPLFFTTSLFSQEFSQHTSFQGFTGVINTPNAQVTHESTMVLHFDNQFDNNLRSYNYDKKDSSQEDYILGFGLFPYMEVQARLSETPGYHRDLSVNTKVQIPYKHEYLPNIAFGIQDLGGAANFYDNKYVVLDKEIYFIRASLGYGISTTEYTKRDRMDGVFGAVELKATDWLYFLAENDTKENHTALRLETPKEWIEQFRLSSMISYNIDTKNTSFALSVEIPLWHTSKIEKLQKNEQINHTPDTLKIPSYKPYVEKNKKVLVSEQNSSFSLVEFQKKLVDFGFENVRVAKKEKHLYIELENTIFDHTDLDAIGYVIGIASFEKSEYEHYTLTLLKNNLKTISINGDFSKFREYVQTPDAVNERALKNNLVIQRDFDDSTIDYSELQNSSLFVPRVKLSLGLVTAVGTEVGVFDYAASLNTTAYLQLYDGLVLSALYQLPFAQSDDFKEGGAYYKPFEYHLQSDFVNIMAHQTLRYDNLINTLSVGKYNIDYIGAMNQTNYTTDSGVHSLKYKGGYFVEEDDSSKDRYFSLSSYEYTYAPFDTSLELTYGKYWQGDVGYAVALERYFGETSLKFIFTDTSLEGVQEQFAGVELSFPLTTRKLLKANYIQVQGDKDFTYKLRTTINKDDGSNRINHYYARVPQSDFEIENVYLDRSRLGESYIKSHLDRIREAYLNYK